MKPLSINATVRVLAVALFAAAMGVCTAPATAQFTAIQTISNLVQPLPPIICPPSSWGWTWCNDVQQRIQTYNQQVATLNQITSTLQQFMAYPQMTGRGLAGQIANFNAVVTYAENGDAAYRSLNSRLFKSTPPPSPSPQLQTTEDLYTNLHDSIAAMLQEDGLIDQSDASDPDTVDMIKTAAANAKSPLQVQQMEVQVLGMVYNAMRREAVENRQYARIAAITALTELAKEKQQSEADASAAQSMQPIVNPRLPKPPPSR